MHATSVARQLKIMLERVRQSPRSVQEGETDIQRFVSEVISLDPSADLRILANSGWGEK